MHQPLKPQRPRSSALSKYGAFVGCEINSDIEQITDEEDGREPTALTVLAIAVAGTLKGRFPGWIGVTATVTGGAYLIGIAENSNRECTNLIYGNP